MNQPSIKINQIYFEESQKTSLCPDFTPYWNSDKDGLYEHGIFQRAFLHNLHREADYTGFVSWKFEKKSFISGQDFLNLAKDYPGKDVYFVNPFPELAGEFKNVWIQGAASHPGLLMLAQSMFDHAGVKIALLDMVNGPHDTAYCNYWYGSQKFWGEFVRFCEPFYKLVQDKTSPFYEEVRKSTKYHGGGTFIPFFLERLFPTFLVLRPDITRACFPWTTEHRNRSLQQMRHQLNLCEAKLHEIFNLEQRRPRWKKWLLG